jgi:tetratricopeptide (TPR) repeat protein
MSLSHSIELVCVRAFRLGVAIALCAGLASGAALAAGDRDDAPEPRPNATATQYQIAKTAIEQGRYAVAIPILENFIKERPRHAGAHNYLAFAHRKLGRLDVAYKLYQKALELDPKHRGAHEYLGELYLQRDDLASAEAMLKKLDGLCFFGCEEYDDLKKAIARYKAEKAKKS